MKEVQEHLERKEYFETRYEILRRLPFTANERILLRDHTGDEPRLCRFCRRGQPEVTFTKDAHAVPDFLGNLSIFSMNECDGCNAKLGQECEDQLSKATMLARVLAGIPR